MRKGITSDGYFQILNIRMPSLTTVSLLAMLVCPAYGLWVHPLPISLQDLRIEDRNARIMELKTVLRSLEAEINKLTSETGTLTENGF